jgi:osmotically-inducible protein OsmY
MKTQPRRARKCACWMAATAGALGLASRAPGQSSPYMPIRPQPQAPAAVTARPTINPEHAAREARIELAWSSNPATFPYNLQARLAGSTVGVYGYVPTEAIRQEALRIAREESGLQVIDGLQIHASLAPPTASRSPQVLSRQAMNALKKNLSTQASHLSVSVWTNGQVLVKGNVSSLAAKLTASRCLRQVSGCTCVINQLRVVEPEPVSVTGGPPVTHSVAPASSVSAAQPAATTPTMGQIILDDSGPVIPVVGRIILDTASPSGSAREQGTWTPTAQTTGEEIKRTAPVSSFQGSLPPNPPATSPASAWDQVKTPYAYHPTTWRRMESAGSPQTTSDAPPGPAVVVSPLAPAGNGEIRQASSQSSDGRAHDASGVNRPVVQATAFVPQTPAPGPLANGPSLPRISPPQPPAQLVLKDVASTIQLGAPGKQESVSRPVEWTRTSVSQPAESTRAPAMITSGLILLDAPQPVVLPKPSPGESPQLAGLQQRIARACGRRPSEVQVTCPAEKTLRVRVQARDPKEAQRLSNAIFQLPELDPYEVSLDIPVSR